MEEMDDGKPPQYQPHHKLAILDGIPKDKIYHLSTTKNKRGRSPLVANIEKPRDSRWNEPFKKLMEAIGCDIPRSDAAQIFRHLLDIHAPGKLGLLLDNIDDSWVPVPNKGTSVLHEAGRWNNVDLVESVWRRFPDTELLEHHNHVGQMPMLEVGDLRHSRYQTLPRTRRWYQCSRRREKDSAALGCRA